MTKYLISFPSEAVFLTEEEFPVVVAESHAVIEEAKAAGVYVFGGGIDEKVDPVLVSSDGSVGTGIHSGSELTGGLTVLELPTREDAVESLSTGFAQAVRGPDRRECACGKGTQRTESNGVIRPPTR